MLSETFPLWKALEDAGLALEKLHPNIKVPGTTTGPAMRLRLSEEGSVFAAEALTEEELPGLWTHMDGNQNSFPVLRLKEPLLHVPGGHQFSWQKKDANGKTRKVTPTERRQEMKEVLLLCSINTGMESTLDMLRRVQAEKVDLLIKAAEQANLEDVVKVCRSYSAALARTEQEENETGYFLNALKERAVAMLAICDENTLDLLELLLFTPANRTGEYTRKSTQVALDTSAPGHTIYRSTIRKSLSAALLAIEGAKSEHKAQPATIPCAFTGSKDEELWIEPFPRVPLPLVATKGASLFSMNSAAPCNERYGRKDSDLMPVSRTLVYKMQDALSYIVQPERRGKTWRGIASENPEQQDLLIVYVDGKPDIDENVADIFGEDADQEQRQFNTDVRTVCEALDGIVKEKPESRLNLFIIRKASEGQVLVTLAETPTVAEVLHGAQWWQEAVSNVPPFSLPIRVQKQVEHWEPQMPSPAQVVRLLTSAWTPPNARSDDSGQARANKLRGAAFGDVLDLMLQRPYKAETAARHILQTLVQHERPLLRGIGGCLHKGNDQKEWNRYSDHTRKEILRAVSVLGMTLYALGSRKEDYVKEAAFLVGRVLALSDRLHRCYCTVVRNGDYPPNLIGNSLFDAALDNPQKALATLAARLRIYLGWAGTVQPEQYAQDKSKHIAAREAISILRRYRPIADELGQMDMSQPSNDLMRAQMLLGYLASMDKTSDEEDKGGENK